MLEEEKEEEKTQEIILRTLDIQSLQKIKISKNNKKSNMNDIEVTTGDEFKENSNSLSDKSRNIKKVNRNHVNIRKNDILKDYDETPIKTTRFHNVALKLNIIDNKIRFNYENIREALTKKGFIRDYVFIIDNEYFEYNLPDDNCITEIITLKADFYERVKGVKKNEDEILKLKELYEK